MADGETTLRLQVTLSESAARRLKEGAARLGVSIDDYASDIVEASVSDQEGWEIDERIAEEADRSGVTYSVQEALAVFDDAMKAHLAKGG